MTRPQSRGLRPGTGIVGLGAPARERQVGGHAVRAEVFPARPGPADLNQALAAALDEAKTDDDVRVLVTGSPRLDGRQCFSAGGDVKAQAEGGAASLGERSHDLVRDVAGAYAGDYLGMLGRAVFRRIETFPKIVVAAVGGVCVGGGLELALACDLVVVAETAQLSEPHVTLHSFTAGEGLTNALARLVGSAEGEGAGAAGGHGGRA